MYQSDPLPTLSQERAPTAQATAVRGWACVRYVGVGSVHLGNGLTSSRPSPNPLPGEGSSRTSHSRAALGLCEIC